MKKYLLLIIFVLALISLQAQNNKLDSIYNAGKKKTPVEYKEPKSKFLHTLRLLFGLSVQLDYMYNKTNTITAKNQYFFSYNTPKFNFQISTPIGINIGMGKSLNYFFNQSRGTKYNNFSLNLHGMWRYYKLTKSSNDGILLAMFGPSYEYNSISDINYSHKSYKLSFFEFMSYEKIIETTKNTEYVDNGNLTVTTNKFIVIDSRYTFQNLKNLIFEIHKKTSAEGSDFFDDFWKINKFQYPLPVMDLYFARTSYEYSNTEGNILDKYDEGLVFDLNVGLQWKPGFALKKINGIVFANFVYMPFSVIAGFDADSNLFITGGFQLFI